MEPRRSFPPTTEVRLDSRDTLWLCLACALVLAIAFLLPVHPNDFWWYLRLGEEIWKNGAIPQVEAWSSTQAGEPVVYHAWLSALFFTGLYRAGGIPAVVLARGLFLVGFYVFTYLAIRHEGIGPRLASGLIVLAVLAGSSNWGVRPQLFAYPLFGAALWILVCWRHGNGRWLWTLPLVTLIWVNLHGSFPLVFLLAGGALLAGGGDRRTLAIVMIAMLLASLGNPRGSGAWHYFGEMLADPSVRRFSSEWKPTALDGWQSGIFFAWLLASLPLATYRARRLPAFYWLWWFSFGWLALSGVRNVIWLTGILALLTATMLKPHETRGHADNRQLVNARINWGLSILLLLLTLPLLPGLRQRWWPQAPEALSADTPVQAAGWLADQDAIRGRMWNDLDFSSYLIFALPEHPVWIDTRFEVYPPESWERYQDISAAGQGWQDWLDRQGIGLVVANNQNQPALIGGLRSLPGWCLRYEDVASTIFMRAERGSGCPAILVAKQGDSLGTGWVR